MIVSTARDIVRILTGMRLRADRFFAAPKRIEREGPTRASLPVRLDKRRPIGYIDGRPAYSIQQMVTMRRRQTRCISGGLSGNAHQRRIQRRAAFFALRNKLTAA